VPRFGGDEDGLFGGNPITFAQRPPAQRGTPYQSAA
jgi:hypothetical protein